MTTPLDDPTRLPVHDIMCIDCKSFYASVEAIRRGIHPLAADIAVLSKDDSPGGLVLAASPNCKKRYHVGLSTRRFQLRDDMQIELAEPRMADYIRKNYGINRIYRQFTDDAHWYPYSIDESFIDVTHSHNLFGTNQEIATQIQKKVFDQFGIITTVGIGQNPLLAKLALDNEAKKAAPWQATWTYDRVPETIWQLNDLADFWSIGSRTAKKLNAIGIHNLYDLAHTDRPLLHQRFGVLGDALYFHSWGIDYSDLTRRYLPRAANKGYGNSQVLMRDYTQAREIEVVLSEIADQVAGRLRHHQVQGEVVSVGIGYADAEETGTSGFGAQMKIDPTNRTDDLIRAARYLFHSKW
ncbi:Y-family DNA polymerase, partial [Lacticaseibacillus paracasei]|uniref:Y-family DNA polymerase n=1 Tax=Lacticaseibacillus paracasei TaxID=1597 RepID=UPI0011CE557F